MSLIPAGAAPRFHRLTIAGRRQESPDAVSFVFAVPPALASDYAFRPGQYLTLRATVDGEDLRRSYSICSGPDDGELRIGVKQAGVFSAWLSSFLHPGDAIDVMTPTGRFGAGAGTQDGRVHVGFAAGSGITPILSILRGVLAREPASRFFLFYGSRTVEDILFRTQLEWLKDCFLGRLSIFHVLSREQQDLAILNGRLDSAKASVLLRHIVPAALVDQAYVCGPLGMIDELQSTLQDIGIPPDRIHVERFVSAHDGRPRVLPPAAPDAAPAHLIALTVDGKRRDIPAAEDEAILDAALRAGIDLPFACRGGMCCTCRAKVVEGSTHMAVNFSLEPWELAAGFVLTCQARPTSARVEVDFDAV